MELDKHTETSARELTSLLDRQEANIAKKESVRALEDTLNRVSGDKESGRSGRTGTVAGGLSDSLRETVRPLPNDGQSLDFQPQNLTERPIKPHVLLPKRAKQSTPSTRKP